MTKVVEGKYAVKALKAVIYVIQINSTGRLIGPFKSNREAEIYGEAELLMPQEAWTIRQIYPA